LSAATWPWSQEGIAGPATVSPTLAALGILAEAAHAQREGGQLTAPAERRMAAHLSGMAR